MFMTQEKKKIISEHMAELNKKSRAIQRAKFGSAKAYSKEMKRRRALNKTSRVKKLSTD